MYQHASVLLEIYNKEYTKICINRIALHILFFSDLVQIFDNKILFIKTYCFHLTIGRNFYRFENYITAYKDQITKLWKSFYLLTNQPIEFSVNKIQNDLVTHIFKKHKIIQQDRLDSYLKDPSA